jgi:hypothetical protein
MFSLAPSCAGYLCVFVDSYLIDSSLLFLVDGYLCDSSRIDFLAYYLCDFLAYYPAHYWYNLCDCIDKSQHLFGIIFAILMMNPTAWFGI